MTAEELHMWCRVNREASEAVNEAQKLAAVLARLQFYSGETRPVDVPMAKVNLELAVSLSRRLANSIEALTR